MTEFCKNHPQRQAKRKCFFCQEYICPECQILASHHYFCSVQCYEKYLDKNIPSRGSREKLELLGHPAILMRKGITFWKTVPWGIVLYVILITAFSISIGTIFKLKSQLKGLEKKIDLVIKAQDENRTSAASIKPLSITKPVNGAMVLTNRIEIEGEARANQIISLSVDGKIEAVTLPENGKFIFKNIAANRGNNSFTIKSISEDGAVTTLETIDIVYNNPTVRYLSNNVTRGNPSLPQIAITFDGGSVANVSEEILDILKAKDLKCTFFLTGQYVKKFPEIVQRMVAEGHEIGNHTWSHPHLTTFAENNMHLTLPGITREFLQRELNKTAEAFAANTGEKMAPYWRAPYGEHNLEIREWAAELGYRHIEWTVGRDWESSMDTMDWVADSTSPAYRTADQILDKILNFGNGSERHSNGSIILMHLGTLRNNDFPHKKLPEIIDGLREQGYELVTISQLIK
jgi:peptidoglycan/xylan/chitin deacetylase (PgdA/CDA1 family)